jgi:hypothetical protein
MKLLLALFLLVGGIAGVLYAFQIVRIFGHMGWAEERLGSGGSYTAWRLIGLIMIVGSVMVVRYY